MYRVYWRVGETEFSLDWETYAEAEEHADDLRSYGNVSSVRVEIT